MTFSIEDAASCMGCGLLWQVVPWIDGSLGKKDRAQLAGLYRHAWLIIPPLGLITPTLLSDEAREKMSGLRRPVVGLRYPHS